jgi:hypothetical protein
MYTSALTVSLHTKAHSPVGTENRKYITGGCIASVLLQLRSPAIEGIKRRLCARMVVAEDLLAQQGASFHESDSVVKPVLGVQRESEIVHSTQCVGMFVAQDFLRRV